MQLMIGDYFAVLSLCKEFNILPISCCAPEEQGTQQSTYKLCPCLWRMAHGFTGLTECQGVICLAQVGSVQDEMRVKQRRGEWIRGSRQR